jgi:hypothetical protein
MKNIILFVLFLSPFFCKAQQSKNDTLELGDMVINFYQPKIDSVAQVTALLKFSNPEKYRAVLDDNMVYMLFMQDDGNYLLQKIGCRRRLDILNWFKNKQ